MRRYSGRHHLNGGVVQLGILRWEHEPEKVLGVIKCKSKDEHDLEERIVA